MTVGGPGCRSPESTYLFPGFASGWVRPRMDEPGAGGGDTSRRA
jgi:hypothetical protein